MGSHPKLQKEETRSLELTADEDERARRKEDELVTRGRITENGKREGRADEPRRPPGVGVQPWNNTIQ
ncbi:hypothetical protein RUM43_010372 [Polyplax serrata]|uniref:Uncharacterized protein n=1 Tax=Polyplax serrata TaxID=468196 RepID=A0AAN8P406_POLSC